MGKETSGEEGEMNDSVIRDRKEELEIVYNKEIALPVKRYSVI